MSADSTAQVTTALPGSPGSRANDTLVAIRSALTLGGSLLFTWGIALAMRLLLPRHLGPDRLGTLTFADSFTATLFVALGLGADVYVRKEVAVRPDHASDFFGGTLVLRAAMSAVLFAALGAFLVLTHRPDDVWALFFVLAAAQLFVHTNSTLSALLHARQQVAGMSALAVGTKVLWAGGVLVAIVLGLGLWAFGLAYLVSEAVESVFLLVLAKRHLGLVVRVDRAATTAMLVASLPYYLNVFATAAYGKLDVTWLALVSTQRDVGWYAASSAVAGLTLLATPLIAWVLMPVFAKAAARSREELFARLSGATEIILTVAIPASLFVILSADLVVHVLFGAAFAPAVLGLQVLAGTFVVTYVAIVYAITLMMLGRPWVLTGISVAGLVVNMGLNVALVRPALGWFGPGGGGAGCGLAMLGTELFVTTTMISFVGSGAVNRRTLVAGAKMLVACAAVVVVHVLLARLGWYRLGVDLLVYVVVVTASGALRTRELGELVSQALRASREREGAR